MPSVPLKESSEPGLDESIKKNNYYPCFIRIAIKYTTKICRIVCFMWMLTNFNILLSILR